MTIWDKVWEDFLKKVNSQSSDNCYFFPRSRELVSTDKKNFFLSCYSFVNVDLKYANMLKPEILNW